MHGNERYGACFDESHTLASRDFVFHTPSRSQPKTADSLEGCRPQSPGKELMNHGERNQNIRPSDGKRKTNHNGKSKEMRFIGQRVYQAKSIGL